MRHARWIAATLLLAAMASGSEGTLARAAGKAVAAGSTSPAKSTRDEIVILSTSDLHAKTSPCGCSTPKGGLSRQASFADSMRAEHAAFLLVDNGGYFPQQESSLEFAPFMVSMMKRMGVQVTGMSELELHFGLAFFRNTLAGSGLNAVCANLIERGTQKSVLPAYAIVTVGRAKVGVFGLITDKGNLGPARDSLVATDPTTAARATVAELKKKGATVIVLLSQIGPPETEKLVGAVEGIDLALIGRQAATMQKGKRIGKSIVCYSGHEGQFMGVTRFGVDAAGQPIERENHIVMLGKEVGEQPEVLGMVKAFEDGFNDRQAVQAKAQAASRTETASATDRYVGVEVCARCHVDEFHQWRTTPHAHAWQALVEAQRNATPDCVACHTIGMGKPGGFISGLETPLLTSVQCENCHGMGTDHESFAKPAATVAEATCRGCHNETTSPMFDFAKYRPHILHGDQGKLAPLPKTPVQIQKMLSGHKG